MKIRNIGDSVLSKKVTLIISALTLMILVYTLFNAITLHDSKNGSIGKVGLSIQNIKLSQTEPLWTQLEFWLYVAIAVIITLATRRFLTQRGIRIWALYRQ